MEDNIIIVAGLSVGGYAESNMLKDAKQKVDNTSPKQRSKGLTISIPISRLAATGKAEMRIPKTNEESTSPMNIVRRETGEDIRRSRVLALASHGTIAGPTDVAVKKAVIPSNPGIRSSIGVSLPM
jgi:hypothetical protein